MDPWSPENFVDVFAKGSATTSILLVLRECGFLVLIKKQDTSGKKHYKNDRAMTKTVLFSLIYGQLGHFKAII